MFLKDATLKISGLVARRFLMTLAAVVMFGGVTNADEFLYTVSGVYDAGVDENLPFTAPSGSINYSFYWMKNPMTLSQTANTPCGMTSQCHTR